MSTNRNLSSRDIVRTDNKKSNMIPIITGCGIVCATLGLSVCGVTSAVRDINRNFDVSVVEAQQTYDNIVENTSKESDVPENENVWTSTQIDWMSKNNITYNEDGLPVDLSGNVVDDPTTKIDETKITSERHEITTNDNQNVVDNNSVVQNDTISDNTSDIDPDIIDSWVTDKDWVETADDGRYYYTVKKGDTLNKIAGMSGFTLDSLVENNDISNPDVIHVGQRIYFPSDGPLTIDESNLGLG